MGLWKALLVVLAYLLIAASMKMLVTPLHYFEYASTFIQIFIFFVLLPGIVSWVLHSGIAHFLSKKMCGGQGKFTDILYGFGVAHFPYIFGALSFMLIFFGAAGFLTFLFFTMFSTLLAYFFFMEALVAFHDFSWKKSFLILVLTSIAVGAIMYVPSSILNMPLQPQFDTVSSIYTMTTSSGTGP